jgi:hypothetical protein
MVQWEGRLSAGSDEVNLTRTLPNGRRANS